MSAGGSDRKASAATITIVKAVLTPERTINRLTEEELIALINAEHSAHITVTGVLAHETGFHAVNVGNALLRAKRDFCQHGNWLSWLRTHCKFSERTAQVYMQAARESAFALKKPNAQRAADLAHRSIRNLITKPKEPRVKRPVEQWPEPANPRSKRIIDDCLKASARAYAELSVSDYEHFIAPDLKHHLDAHRQRMARGDGLKDAEVVNPLLDLSDEQDSSIRTVDAEPVK